jgi:novobiocin biosynthesis protein NovU/D-mycarose 3-C-methyltransferase
MYHKVTSCRACGWGKSIGPGGIKASGTKEELIPVLSLGVQPLANDFRRPGEEHAGYAPLEVLFCPRCSLAQLSVVVKPEILYRNYSFVTSPSKTMRDHFTLLLRDILTEQKPGSVVEIGSNDGLFLAFLSDHGFGNVVGIDPAQNIAPEANKKGITTINDFFNLESAKLARENCGEVGLVVARHCFCHMDDWQGCIAALDPLTSKDTLICIEVPYAPDQLRAGSFDQVYHEHLSYLTLKSVKYLLNGTNYHLHRICHYQVHGGCVLMMIRRNDCLTPPHDNVAFALESEKVTADSWKHFADEAEIQIVRLGNEVRDLVQHGKKVCGYGASAKSTVWVSACKFTRRELAFICDSTASKVYSNSQVRIFQSFTKASTLPSAWITPSFLRGIISVRLWSEKSVSPKAAGIGLCRCLRSE